MPEIGRFPPPCHLPCVLRFGGRMQCGYCRGPLPILMMVSYRNQTQSQRCAPVCACVKLRQLFICQSSIHYIAMRKWFRRLGWSDKYAFFFFFPLLFLLSVIPLSRLEKDSHVLESAKTTIRPFRLNKNKHAIGEVNLDWKSERNINFRWDLTD